MHDEKKMRLTGAQLREILLQNRKMRELLADLKYYIKKYDYILIDIGKDSDEFVKEEILKNSDKRIII